MKKWFWWQCRALCLLVITGLFATGTLTPLTAQAKADPKSPKFHEFIIPTSGSQPIEITKGPDGAFWFTEFITHKIGRVSTSGEFTEYTVPTPSSSPFDITLGPDKALWFTEEATNKIGRLTTSGFFSEFAIPTADSEPDLITSFGDVTLGFHVFP